MLGDNNIGRFGVIFHFLAEVLDMDAEQVPGIHISISPDFSQQAFMGEDTAFVPD